MLESGQTWSHEQLLIDNDIVLMIQRAIQGIEVDEDTMATELVKQSHQIKDFLHQRHTVKYMRTQSRPHMIDRNTRGAWEAKGGKNLTTVAHETVAKVLKTHQVEPLSDDAKKTISEIVAKGKRDRVKV